MNRHRGVRYFARSVCSVVLFLPALLAMQSAPSTGTVDEAWRYIAMAAMGGLVTAFALGRNAVTKGDLIAFEAKMTAAMEKQSPWAAVVDHRLAEGAKKFEYLETRVHQIAEQGQVALGLKEFTLTVIEANRQMEGRVAKLERDGGQ